MGILGKIFGGNSEARQKAKKYKKLVDQLEGKIADIKENLTWAEEGIGLCHDTLISNPDSAEGMLMTTFEQKEEKWKGKYTKIISNINACITVLEAIKQNASNMEAHWNRVADMEEMTNG